MQTDLPKIYNPDNQTPEELIKNFVVRTNLFRELFQDIKNSEMKHPEQHFIIQGIRGQGKTTLLLRIAYEINKDKNLREKIIPIIFNEEQYNVSRLYKLWETIADYLEEYNEVSGLYDLMQKLENDDDYERRCFQLLENTLKKNNKKIVLFIDNIDEMLDKFSQKEHHRLREVFIESAELRVVGASSVSLEFHYDYGKPFYQFFHMLTLKGLTSRETKTLLLKLGEHYKRERVKEIVKTQPGRIEALRRLTGGVIRTVVILFQIFVDDQNGDAFQDLETILDSVTPLYKHRMDRLSAQQQEIVDFIALNWDAVSTKEIAQKTKLKSKAVSSQLKQLDKYHIIEKEKSNTKNYLYRISERFFNIWYLMRHGRKWDEKRVRFLVEFLQIWCDEKVLEMRAAQHINAIKKGDLYEKQALFMAEALARTTIRQNLHHDLLYQTRSYLKNKHSSLSKYVSQSDFELRELSEKSPNTINKIQSLEKIKNKTDDDYNLLGFLFITEKKDLEKSKLFWLKAVGKEHAGAMYNLALMYQSEFKDFKKAEKYYLMAVEKEYADAMYNLALMYQSEFKNFKKAEKYYLMAVEKEHVDAMNNLAVLFYSQKINREESLRHAKNAFDIHKKINHSISYAMILVWNNKFENLLKISKLFLNDEKTIEEYSSEIGHFFIFLIAKKQFYLTLKIFNENPHNLKDRFKPIYYALMHFMKAEYPNEYRKIGGELKETVSEIIKKINQIEKDYA